MISCLLGLGIRILFRGGGGSEDYILVPALLPAYGNIAFTR